uniref:Uncharacterized protein n=1 Tax=Timema monikensis TaxID=170555 RepID=A0A7R9EDK2_9NEOP|nr:unnamed protein product [Timema monikensis]
MGSAVLTRDAARLTESFCFSVGLGDDFVMRLSVDSTENLRTNILDALHRCRLPKYRLMLNGFGYTLFGVPTGDLETTWKPEEASPSTLLGHSPLLEAAPVKTSISSALPILPQLSPTSHRDFVLPGRFSCLPPRLRVAGTVPLPPTATPCCRDSFLYLPPRLRVAGTVPVPPTTTPCCRDCSLTSHRDFVLPGLCPITLQPSSTLPTVNSRDGIHPPRRQGPPTEDPKEDGDNKTVLHPWTHLLRSRLQLLDHRTPTLRYSTCKSSCT